MAIIGKDLKHLAIGTIYRDDRELDLTQFKVAAVPVSSGEGVIPTFCNAVSAITGHLGMQSFITQRADVSGLTDAIRLGADIVFMADDSEFIALKLLKEG